MRSARADESPRRRGWLLALAAVGLVCGAACGAQEEGLPLVPDDRVALTAPRRGSSEVSPQSTIELEVWGFGGDPLTTLARQLEQQLKLVHATSGKRIDFRATCERHAAPLYIAATLTPSQELPLGEYRVTLDKGALTSYGLDATFFVGHRVRVLALALKGGGGGKGGSIPRLALTLSQPVSVQGMRQALSVRQKGGSSISIAVQSACISPALPECREFSLAFPSGFAGRDATVRIDAQRLASAKAYLDGTYRLKKPADAASATSFSLSIDAGDFGRTVAWRCGPAGDGDYCTKSVIANDPKR